MSRVDANRDLADLRVLATGREAELASILADINIHRLGGRNPEKWRASVSDTLAHAIRALEKASPLGYGDTATVLRLLRAARTAYAKRRAEGAFRRNRTAYHFAQTCYKLGVKPAKVVKLLVERFGLSERTAWRYVREMR